MIPAVVLAAGLSSRMGQPKAGLPLPGGDTFLSRIVHTFLEGGIDDVVVVVGHEAEGVISAYRTGRASAYQAGVRHVSDTSLTPRFVVNPDYERGQLSSILAGLHAIDRPGVAAMLLTLVDVPLVSAPTVRAVVERYRSTRAPIVRPTSGARHGHPVLIDRSVFDALRRADPASGARPVIRAFASPAGDLPINDAGAFTDIDTPEEYERLMEGRAGGA